MLKRFGMDTLALFVVGFGNAHDFPFRHADLVGAAFIGICWTRNRTQIAGTPYGGPNSLGSLRAAGAKVLSSMCDFGFPELELVHQTATADLSTPLRSGRDDKG